MKRIIFTLLIIILIIASGACSSSGTTVTTSSSTQPPTTTTTIPEGAELRGTILYNGKPVNYYTSANVRIGLIEIEHWQNTPVQSSYDPQTGFYSVEGIPPGEYLPSIIVESGFPYDSESGGDFTGRLSGINPNVVVSSASEVIDRDLSVVYHVHVFHPFDNQERTIAVTDEPENIFDESNAPLYTFEWEEVPDAVTYRITIMLKNDSGNTSEGIANETIDSTSFSLELGSTGPDQYYMFSVNAYNAAQELVGLFQYYYTNGSGGWYKFVIQP